MKEWICREMSTSTSGNENGVLMMETELVRCKDCKWFSKGDNGFDAWECCTFTFGKYINVDENHFCSWAEREDEYVTLHQEDIHFIDEDAERAFYESLAERKEK